MTKISTPPKSIISSFINREYERAEQEEVKCECSGGLRYCCCFYQAHAKHFESRRRKKSLKTT